MDRLRKFLILIDDEVAFTWAPNPEWIETGYELVVSALASNPKIVEIPVDSEQYPLVRGGWKYIDGVLLPPEE
jgi:hypothetical protein